MAGDLNLKKSWNPALVKNQQKVWELEQGKLKDYKDYQEKKQERKREEEYLELLKLQYGDNFNRDQLSQKEKLKVSKLSWMYDDVPFEGPAQETTNSSGFIESNQEFNEGKNEVEQMLNGKYAMSKKARNDGSTSERMNKILKAEMSTTGGASSNNKFADDPLAMIKQQQQQKQQLLRHRQKQVGSRTSDGARERSSRHKVDEGRHGSKHRVHKAGDSDRNGESRREHRPRDGDRHHHHSHKSRDKSSRVRSPTRES